MKEKTYTKEEAIQFLDKLKEEYPNGKISCLGFKAWNPNVACCFIKSGNRYVKRNFA